MVYSDLEEKTARMRKLKERFIEGIRQVDHVSVHGLPDETSAPHIVSVGIAGIRSEVLLHTLEEKGIYVSSGSACSSNHPGISGVLKGIGVEREYLDATLRFSLSEFTTEEEIDYTLKHYIIVYRCSEDTDGDKGERNDISDVFDKIRRDCDQREEPLHV